MAHAFRAKEGVRSGKGEPIRSDLKGSQYIDCPRKRAKETTVAKDFSRPPNLQEPPVYSPVGTEDATDSKHCEAKRSSVGGTNVGAGG